MSIFELCPQSPPPCLCLHPLSLLHTKTSQKLIIPRNGILTTKSVRLVHLPFRSFAAHNCGGTERDYLGDKIRKLWSTQREGTSRLHDILLCGSDTIFPPVTIADIFELNMGKFWKAIQTHQFRGENSGPVVNSPLPSLWIIHLTHRPVKESSGIECSSHATIDHRPKYKLRSAGTPNVLADLHYLSFSSATSPHSLFVSYFPSSSTSG